MNKIWSLIIIISFIYSIFSNNFDKLINSIFDVPKESLNLLLSLGGLIILYNGFFQILIDCKLIKKISFLFKPILIKIYKIDNSETLDLLCANFTANLLGLGIASTPIVIKILKNESNEKIINKLICINTACFTIMPITIISIRESYNSGKNFSFYIILILTTFLSTIFSIIICNIGDTK